MADKSSAERQKRYRERLKQNPIKYQEFRKKQLDRVRQYKMKIKLKKQKEKENMRQKWREYCARYYSTNKSKSICEPNTAQENILNNNEKCWKFKANKFRIQLKFYRQMLNNSVKKQESMRKQIYQLKQKILTYENQFKEEVNEYFRQTLARYSQKGRGEE